MPPRYRRLVKRQLKNLALAVLYVIFTVVGLIGWLRTEKRKDFAACEVKKILIIRLDLLGDVVLSSPAIRALRDAYPNAHIAMLVLPYTAQIVRLFPEVDEVYTFDINQLRPSGDMLNLAHYGELYHLLRRLRRERFDLCVSLYGLWASLFSYGSGAHFRVGYRGESYPFMHNIAIGGRRYCERKHEVEWNLVLAKAGGAKRTDLTFKLVIPRDVEEKVLTMLKQEGVNDGDLLIGMHCGASNGSAKRWMTNGWAVLADTLIREKGAKVVFTGSANELPLVGEVVEQMQETPIVMAGRTDLLELAALVRRCRLFVSGDSGPLHIAVALGIPTVAVHGPTDPAISGPYDPNAAVVRKPLPCSPCYDSYDVAECPKDNPVCMKMISAGEVYAAVERMFTPTVNPCESSL